MDLSGRNIIWRTVALLVGALFIFAGVTKMIEFNPVRVLDPMEFARGIDNYKLLPWAASVGLSLFLPWLEIICGLALIFRRLYSGAIAIVLALMLVFIVASIAAKARGIDITCGCFGGETNRTNFAGHIVLNVLMLATAAALASMARRSFQSEQIR